MGRYLVRIPYQNGYMDVVAQTTNMFIENGELDLEVLNRIYQKANESAVLDLTDFDNQSEMYHR